MALVAGIFFALLIGNPWLGFTKKWNSPLLMIAVVGLGFGTNLEVVARVGVQGFGYTIASIAAAFFFGWLLAKIFQVPKDIAVLITSGTAICGGSAIASVAVAMNAKSEEISTALATVFFLNAIGLIVFPTIGTFFHLDQSQFGLWCALAIHDTSSVVGAAAQFGKQALEIGTTVKLARALWIVPVTLGVSALYHSHKTKIKIPWFILGFLLASALVTWIPFFVAPGTYLLDFARKLLILTLFFTGANLTAKTLRDMGFRPFLLGLTLWITLAVASLGGILANWLRV